MWVFLKNAYLSIVADKKSRETLLVRARFAGDIERVFGKVEVTEGAGTDYRFRARVARTRVAEMLAEQARTLAATNFKASVDESWRHDVYMKVWTVLKRAQDRRT